MSVLTAAQRAIMKLVGTKPAAVVSSDDEICVEMTALMQDAAEEIAKAADWQALVSFYTISTDGTTTDFALPPDYDRMVQATEIANPDVWFWNYRHVVSYSDWQQLKLSNFGFITPGIWTIYQNQFHFLPAPVSGGSAIFPYVSNGIFIPTSGSPKATVTADSDEFFLGDRILYLALVWKWLSLKRMDYQQELDDYNIAISEMATRDKGARSIRKSARVPTLNARIAWPWSLG